MPRATSYYFNKRRNNNSRTRSCSAAKRKGKKTNNMPKWNNNIKIEVKLPYITQGCTLDYLTAKLNITNEDIWFSGHDKEGLCWKAYVTWGDYPILVFGKATTNDGKLFNTTTYKVTAWCSCDGTNKGKEQYKTRVLSYS